MTIEEYNGLRIGDTIYYATSDLIIHKCKINDIIAQPVMLFGVGTKKVSFNIGVTDFVVLDPDVIFTSELSAAKELIARSQKSIAQTEAHLTSLKEFESSWQGVLLDIYKKNTVTQLSDALAKGDLKNID